MSFVLTSATSACWEGFPPCVCCLLEASAARGCCRQNTRLAHGCRGRLFGCLSWSWAAGKRTRPSRGPSRRASKTPASGSARPERCSRSRSRGPSAPGPTGRPCEAAMDETDKRLLSLDLWPSFVVAAVFVVVVCRRHVTHNSDLSCTVSTVFMRIGSSHPSGLWYRGAQKVQRINHLIVRSQPHRAHRGCGTHQGDGTEVRKKNTRAFIIAFATRAITRMITVCRSVPFAKMCSAEVHIYTLSSVL